MAGKRNNLSSADVKILKFLFTTVGFDDNDLKDLKKKDYDMSKIMDLMGLDKNIDSCISEASTPKSTNYIKIHRNANGIETRNSLVKLREFGLVNKIEKHTKLVFYWSITDSGRYCVLAKSKKDEIINLLAELNKEDKHDIFSLNESEYVIINRFISNGNWGEVEELLDKVNECIDKHHYKAIMNHVRKWFKRFSGTNLLLPE